MLHRPTPRKAKCKLDDPSPSHTPLKSLLSRVHRGRWRPWNSHTQSQRRVRLRGSRRGRGRGRGWRGRVLLAGSWERDVIRKVKKESRRPWQCNDVIPGPTPEFWLFARLRMRAFLPYTGRYVIISSLSRSFICARGPFVAVDRGRSRASFHSFFPLLLTALLRCTACQCCASLPLKQEQIIRPTTVRTGSPNRQHMYCVVRVDFHFSLFPLSPVFSHSLWLVPSLVMSHPGS